MFGSGRSAVQRDTIDTAACDHYDASLLNYHRPEASIGSGGSSIGEIRQVRRLREFSASGLSTLAEKLRHCLVLAKARLKCPAYPMAGIGVSAT